MRTNLIFLTILWVYHLPHGSPSRLGSGKVDLTVHISGKQMRMTADTTRPHLFQPGESGTLLAGLGVRGLMSKPLLMPKLQQKLKRSFKA